MNIEDRLEKLSERVDAIARNLELLSGMQIKTEERLQQFIDAVDRGMTQVARALVNHERRIDTLEGNRQ